MVLEIIYLAVSLLLSLYGAYLLIKPYLEEESDESQEESRPGRN